MAEAKKPSKAKQAKEAELVAETAPEEVEVKPAEAVEAEEPKAEAKKSTAKAGKRSAKAQAEAEEKQAKEERKAATAEAQADDKPKTAVKPPRTRAERAGKKYREAYKLIEADKSYSLAEAMELATKTSPTKFDATVEMHLNLGVDPKQADQNVRGNLSLPAGTGKTLRIAVLAEGDEAVAATKAGADTVGSDDLLASLEKEDINFDILIATPAMMPRLGKYARLLGPRGLMPNPKSGTVTQDTAKAVSEAKAGRVEYRVDPSGIVHLGIGKVSFGAEKLQQNADALLTSIRANKPASTKGTYIKAVHVTTTMGPSIRVEL